MEGIPGSKSQGTIRNPQSETGYILQNAITRECNDLAAEAYPEAKTKADQKVPHHRSTISMMPCQKTKAPSNSSKKHGRPRGTKEP